MEVGQSPNWGCSAKEIISITLLLLLSNEICNNHFFNINLQLQYFVTFSVIISLCLSYIYYAVEYCHVHGVTIDGVWIGNWIY
jgi:hypothetical protein